LASLRSKDGEHEDKYEDADVYKALSTFDERIASIQEIVVLEANEMADGAIKKFATTARAAAGGGGGGGGAGKPKEHDGIDALFLPLLDESSTSQTAASTRRRGLTPGPEGGKPGATAAAAAAGDVDPEELVGIDPDVYVCVSGWFLAYLWRRSQLNRFFQPHHKTQGPLLQGRGLLAGAERPVFVRPAAGGGLRRRVLRARVGGDQPTAPPHGQAPGPGGAAAGGHGGQPRARAGPSAR